MNPAQRALAELWWRPGGRMDAGWWPHLEMEAWRGDYQRRSGLRPPLDRMIAGRLGQGGALPALSDEAEALLADDARRGALCLMLGLWSQGCPDYLLLRAYRAPLAAHLDEVALARLPALLPTRAGAVAEWAPEALCGEALRHGGAWLARAEDPAVAVCRLHWAPLARAPRADSPLAALRKLLKWL
ncbi:hypothetical protein JQK19_20845 [Chromobacterium violaceum]|uniref:type III secretion system domain-containing protein n=1 Tax=Chromobacterium violaceum TaxID=536 RepID=UPI001BE506C0|nr:hypothetical protein [Chromobacterium violaceum]